MKKEGLLAGIGIIRFVFVACVCYLFLFPLIYLLISAVQDPTTALDPSVVWIPKKLTLDNFKEAFILLDYRNSFITSLTTAVFSTVATLLSCAMAGYALARFNFFGKRAAFIIVLLLIVVPPQTTSMSVFLNYRFFNPLNLVSLLSPLTGIESFDLLGSPVTMILPALFASGLRAGLSIFIFRQFFLGQPKELEEAAKIDGCGAFSTYFKIMLPLSSPAIITVSVFSFVWYWNDTFLSSLFFTGDLKPLATKLDVLRTTFLADVTNRVYSTQQQKVIISAAALLCIIPPLILYLVIQRKFSESIERTGIVG